MGTFKAIVIELPLDSVAAAAKLANHEQRYTLIDTDNQHWAVFLVPAQCVTYPVKH